MEKGHGARKKKAKNRAPETTNSYWSRGNVSWKGKRTTGREWPSGSSAAVKP
jgi:hypothetical protein